MTEPTRSIILPNLGLIIPEATPDEALNDDVLIETLDDERLNYEDECRKADLAKKHQENKEQSESHALRKEQLDKLFKLTKRWILVLWIIILFQGFKQSYISISWFSLKLNFVLSDAVLIAFITTTTTTVLGLYGIAAYWLFGKNKQEPDDKPNKSKPDKTKKPK